MRVSCNILYFISASYDSPKYGCIPNSKYLSYVDLTDSEYKVHNIEKISSNVSNQDNSGQVDKNNDKDENKELSDITFGEEFTKKEVLLNEEDKQLLNNIVGDYGRCKGVSCSGFNILKYSNERFYYTHYLPNSGGFRTALIFHIKKLSDNKYEITGYYPATSGNSILGENPEKEEKIVIDISKTSNKPTKDSTKNNTKRPKIGL